MTIEIKRNSEEIVVVLVGRLDTTTAPALEETVNDFPGDVKNIVFDFKGLEYISSAGLRVLLNTQKNYYKKGSMKLINVCESVTEVLEMTGFADILVIER